MFFLFLYCSFHSIFSQFFWNICACVLIIFFPIAKINWSHTCAQVVLEPFSENFLGSRFLVCDIPLWFVHAESSLECNFSPCKLHDQCINIWVWLISNWYQRNTAMCHQYLNLKRENFKKQYTSTHFIMECWWIQTKGSQSIKAGQSSSRL